MSALHNARFSWPSTRPHTVVITGSFDNWCGDKHKLDKTPHGFEGVIPLEFGRVHEYKYVVDGTWQVREDEDKEWDDAGNMNNVRRTPPAPASSTELSPPNPSSQTSSTTANHSSNLIASAAPGPTASVASVKDAEGLAISPSPRINELPAAVAAEQQASGLTPSQAVVRDVENSESIPSSSSHAAITTSTTSNYPPSSEHTSSSASHFQTIPLTSDLSKTPTQPVTRLLDEVAEVSPAARQGPAEPPVARLLDGLSEASPDVLPVQEGGTAATVEAAVSSAVGSLGGLVHGVEEYLFGDRHPTTEKGPIEGAAEEQVEGIQKLEISNVSSSTTSNLNITSTPSSHLSSSYSDTYTNSPTSNYALPDGLNLGAPIGLGAPINGDGHVASTTISSNFSAPSESENGTETTDFSLVDDASTTSHADTFEHVSHPVVVPTVPVSKPSPSPDRSATTQAHPPPAVAPSPIPAVVVPPPASPPAPLAARARPSTPPQPSPSTTSPLATATTDPATEIKAKLREKDDKPKVRSGPIPGSGETIPESANIFSQNTAENLSEQEGLSAEHVGPSAGRTLASKSVVPDHSKQPSSPRAAPRTSGTYNRNSVHSQSGTPLSASQTSAVAPTGTSSTLLTPSGSTATFTPASSAGSSPASSTRRDDNASGTGSTMGTSKEKKRKSVFGKISGIFGKGKEK